MRIEKRYTGDGQGGSKPRCLVLIVESEQESELLDWAFGKAVGEDGLIGTSKVECRLEDGYGKHYLTIPVVEGAGEE